MTTHLNQQLTSLYIRIALKKISNCSLEKMLLHYLLLIYASSEYPQSYILSHIVNTFFFHFQCICTLSKTLADNSFHLLKEQNRH